MHTIFWILIGFILLAGISLLIIQHNKNKDKLHNFVVKMWGKKWILHYATPFWITIILTFVFNLSLMGMHIEATPYSLMGMTINFQPCFLIAINLGFSILTFFLSLELQRCFLHILFSRTFINAMNETANEHFVLQAFTVELYKQFANTDNFLTHLKDVNFKNIDELIKNIKASEGGVSLSTYLYAVLLKESLLQKPSILFSVWNLEIVQLTEKNDYAFYTNYLNNIYKTLDKNKKKRIFISNANTDITEDIKVQHKNWGFDNIYWCNSTTFEDIRRKSNANEKYDDFILFESGKNKWIIGKDKDDKKTRICYKDETVDNIKNFFSDDNIQQYESITL
ncbi:hypothetical protein [Dysgonomonas termitidis]|uniref:Uncharacterized protein n=1 Tax=Dysgonomonas termitidis TaxID=1516126 RepID=A0ABV9L3M7_9BACT